MSGQILVAYDTDGVGDNALRFAFDRANPDERVQVLHVMHAPERTTGEIRTRIESVAGDSDVPYEIDIVDPGESDETNVSVSKRILDRVQGGDYELVVMGNQQRGTLEEFIVGSVTESIIESRNVPVALVP